MGDREPALDAVLAEARACTLCAAHLPLGPRPVLVATPAARLLIIGQAPGTKVHETGVPWNDPSGDRLRDWLGIGRDTFYGDPRIAIVPMGFCYPGRDAKGGDLPPRRECTKLWHDRLFSQLQQIELYVLVGQYAHRWHLRERAEKRVSDTVANWRNYALERSDAAPSIPLPHPSWRNNAWLRKNPWFETEVLPHLRGEVRRLLD